MHTRIPLVVSLVILTAPLGVTPARGALPGSLPAVSSGALPGPDVDSIHAARNLAEVLDDQVAAVAAPPREVLAVAENGLRNRLRSAAGERNDHDTMPGAGVRGSREVRREGDAGVGVDSGERKRLRAASLEADDREQGLPVRVGVEDGDPAIPDESR